MESVHLDLPARNIHEILTDQADQCPDDVALEFQGRKILYRQVAAQSRRFASALHSMDVDKGHRVGIMLPNSPEFVYAYYGALMAGATVVLYNIMLKPRELDFLLRHSETSVMVVDHKVLPFIEEIAGDIRTLKQVLSVGSEPLKRELDTGNAWQTPEYLDFTETLNWSNPGFRPIEIAPEDLALLVYTSGTTGKPKGAMLSHANVLANMASILRMRPPEESVRVLCVLPLFHVFGLIAVLNMTVLRGGTIVLEPRFDPASTLEALKTKGITTFSGTPTMYFQMMNHPASEGATFPALKRAGSGAAPMPPEIRKRFHDRFGIEITEGYGLSEATVSVCGYPYGLPLKSGSVGIPIPGIEVRIADESGNDVPIGDVGELLVKGPSVMVGYFKDPEATDQTIREGWLHTGDLGRMDDKGYIFIVDRKKDMIIKGGFNIYPREIEDLIYEIPEVDRAAVIGVPDPDKGELPEAVITLKPGKTLTPEAVMEHLKGKLARYKQPASVLILPELPLGPTGKILKRELRELWKELKGSS